MAYRRTIYGHLIIPRTVYSTIYVAHCSAYDRHLRMVRYDPSVLTYAYYWNYINYFGCHDDDWQMMNF